MILNNLSKKVFFNNCNIIETVFFVLLNKTNSVIT